MLRKLLLLTDETADSQLLVQQALNVFCKTNLPAITTAYINGTAEINLSPLFDKAHLNNNQYSFLDIVDKIYHTNKQLDLKSISQYKKQFEEYGIQPALYLDDIHPEQKLISDAKYFDMMLVGHNMIKRMAMQYAKRELLTSIFEMAETPIMLVPNNPSSANRIVILFDGSNSSMLSIKLFFYLLADSFSHMKIDLFTIINESSIASEKKMCDFIKRFQLSFSITRVYEETWRAELFPFLKEIGEFVLVNGVDKHMIIDDCLENASDSFFIQPNRSVFIY